ncbi:protein gamma response 1-like [Rhododendron vialii]|uniref:protein gamma response 1-like n=1 Tax=Rhododendron vialii TaxID=182163 RepID=UPI00266023CD|nr:protein gamma response 1-like [Rhododendron vialii]
MEQNLQKSPQLGHPLDIGDAKYVSGLSTVLVATIREAKDRISQIEYIFCSQLFPNFQSQSKSLQKIYSKATKAAEDEWKKKENHLLLAIENLQHKKKLILEENRSLKLEKSKFVNHEDVFPKKIYELQEELKQLFKKEGDLKQKIVEVANGGKMQVKLPEGPEAKAAVQLNMEKIVEELEEKNNLLLKKQRGLELENQEVRGGLLRKFKEVDEGMKSHNILLQLVQSKATLIVQKEKQLKEQEEKTNKIAKTVLQQIDSNNLEMLKIGQQLEVLEKEKTLLLAKIKGLEEKVDKLHVDLRQKNDETSEGMELHGKLLQQIKQKTPSCFLRRRKGGIYVIAAYKSLKSQYNFLRAKCGLTPEIMLPLSKIEDGSDSLRRNSNPLTSPGVVPDKRNIAPNAMMVSCEITEEKENLEDDKGSGLIQRSSANSPCASSDAKPGTLAGTKCPGSSWRETRSHQKRGGLDPHDDFFDTPLENIKVLDFSKGFNLKEEVNLPYPLPRHMNFDSSDDETQDVNGDPGRQKPQMPDGTRGFKYIELVRKKADRENLKGIECRQCKKFFDDVLPDEGGNKQQLRCEHHDGVSRHRYRFAPPLTPEGFWNIGFESEM